MMLKKEYRDENIFRIRKCPDCGSKNYRRTIVKSIISEVTDGISKEKV